MKSHVLTFAFVALLAGAASAQSPKEDTPQTKLPAAPDTGRGEGREQRQPEQRKSEQRQPADRAQPGNDKRGQVDDRRRADPGEKSNDGKQTQSRDQGRGERKEQARDPQERDPKRAKDQPQDRERRDRAQQPREGRDGQSRDQAGDRRPGAEPPRQAAKVTPELDEAQRQRIREGFERERSQMRQHTNVNIRITVGQRAPRNWAYVPLPAFLVEVVPQYRGYRVAWVEERYVIVEPSTYEVVAYIEADSGRLVSTGSGRVYGSRGRDECIKVTLSPEQRLRVVEQIEVRRERDVARVKIGSKLPASVELLTFPDPVAQEVSVLAGCRYVAIDDDRIAIVAPRSREIVAIIER